MSERVTMRWPEGLKDRVRAAVGERGITQFTVSAVERALFEQTGPVNAPEESGPISGPIVPVSSLEAIKESYGLVTGRSLQTAKCPNCSSPLPAGAECAACSF